MDLKRDISIFCGPEISLEERAFISSGVEALTVINGIILKRNIFVPKLDWQPLTNQQLKLIGNEGVKFNYYHGALLRLPSNIFAGFTDLGIRDMSQEEINPIVSSVPFNVALEKLKAFLHNFTTRPEEMIFHTPCSTSGQLRSTAFNPETSSFAGLHMDNWEGLHLDNRHRSRNRICVNLGHLDRSITFINLSVIKLHRAVLNYIQVPDPSADDITNTFLKCFPTYPVIKLQIRPGEAYLLPTESVIHDGETLDNWRFDIRLTIRGYFDIFK